MHYSHQQTTAITTTQASCKEGRGGGEHQKPHPFLRPAPSPQFTTQATTRATPTCLCSTPASACSEVVSTRILLCSRMKRCSSRTMTEILAGLRSGQRGGTPSATQLIPQPTARQGTACGGNSGPCGHQCTPHTQGKGQKRASRQKKKKLCCTASTP